MARRNPLAALIGLAAVAGAVASVVREHTRREPRIVRRRLTEAEVIGLDQARSAISRELPVYWPGLDPEDAARIATAYPAFWALAERKH